MVNVFVGGDRKHLVFGALFIANRIFVCKLYPGIGGYGNSVKFILIKSLIDEGKVMMKG